MGDSRMGWAALKRWLKTHPWTSRGYRFLYEVRYSSYVKHRLLHPSQWLRLWRSHAFDRRHGTDTQYPLDSHQYDLNKEAYGDGTVYVPSNPSLFQQVLSLLPLDPAGYVFLDIGSGKGLALLLAADFPFRRIIGVEYSPMLHHIAENNLRVYRGAHQRCFDLQLRCANVLHEELPEEALVIYLYNPFGAETMRGFLERLHASLQAHPRPLWVVYFNPQQHALLEAAPFLVERTREILGAAQNHELLLRHYKVYAAASSVAPVSS